MNLKMSVKWNNEILVILQHSWLSESPSKPWVVCNPGGNSQGSPASPTANTNIILKEEWLAGFSEMDYKSKLHISLITEQCSKRSPSIWKLWDMLSHQTVSLIPVIISYASLMWTGCFFHSYWPWRGQFSWYKFLVTNAVTQKLSQDRHNRNQRWN